MAESDFTEDNDDHSGDTNVTSRSSTRSPRKSMAILTLEFNKLSNAVDKKIEELNKFTSNEIGKIQDSVKQQIDELTDRQVDQIQTLSIFVAFFTFVSVEFQLLVKQTETLNLTGYTLILLGSLVLFVLLLDITLSGRKLQYTKIRTKELSFLRQLSATYGYEESVPFLFLDPDTWGDAFKIKIVPMMFISILLIAGGVLLISVVNPALKQSTDLEGSIQTVIPTSTTPTLIESPLQSTTTEPATSAATSTVSF